MGTFRQAISGLEGCEHCNDSLRWAKELLAHPLEHALPLWQLLKQCGVPAAKWGTTRAMCPSCGMKLELVTLLVLDETSLEDELGLEVAGYINRKYIGECELCNVDIIPFTQRHGDPINLNTVHELLDEYEVPDGIREIVLTHIQCRCGNQLREEDVYVTKAAVDDWYGLEAQKFVYDTFAIEEEEADQFFDYLVKYPMLGIEHPIGKRIYEALRDRTVPGFSTLKPGHVLYRCRTRDKVERRVPFIAEELWAPPAGLPRHGRFNPVGVAVLYLADSPKTCLSESGPHSDTTELAEVAEFVLLRNTLVWDARGLDVSELLSVPARGGTPLSLEYIFPNFIGQCCAQSGVSGLVYGSVKHRKGWNLALFDYEADRNIHLSKVFESVSKAAQVTQAHRRKRKATLKDFTAAF